MSNFDPKRILVAAMVGGSMLAASVAPASSAVFSVSPRAATAAIADSNTVIPVAQRDKRNDRNGRTERNSRTQRNDNYDRRRHGPRYTHKREGYGHYRNGYWYRAPFWALAIPFAGAAASDNSRHASWCDNRYRSYNHSRDAFKGYDGKWHRCNSPYN